MKEYMNKVLHKMISLQVLHDNLKARRAKRITFMRPKEDDVGRIAAGQLGCIASRSQGSFTPRGTSCISSRTRRGKDRCGLPCRRCDEPSTPTPVLLRDST